MEADTQVSQLEHALLQQAEARVREHQESAAATCARILAESEEKVKRAEEHEILLAKLEAERLLRRQTQAAESRLAGDLDRLRWALTEAALADMKKAFQQLVLDEARYTSVIESWLAAAAQALPPGDLVAEVRSADEKRLTQVWTALAARAAPGRSVALTSHHQPSEGGIRVRLASNRAQFDQTFEARQQRLADELARVVMEQLFASTPDLGSLAHR